MLSHLYIAVRDVPKGEAVVKDILATSSGQGKLELVKLSLDSLASVREAAADFLSRSPQLNVLICNAGEAPGHCMRVCESVWCAACLEQARSPRAGTASAGYACFRT